MVDNEQLALMILDWAKENHPHAYEQTLSVASRPEVYRTYMLRLVEIRYERDKSFRAIVPISVLDETGLTIKVRRRDQSVIELKGRRAKPPIVRRIAELAMTCAQWDMACAASATLDLEYVHE